MTRCTIGLLFGGCSGEHEVSIASARAIAQALSTGANVAAYTLLPFYIQKSGQWCDGAIAQQVLNSGQPLSPELVPTDTVDRWHLPPTAADVDVWFPVLHGPNGEDGTVQGLLTLMQAPFVGSGILGSAIGMDKLTMKMVFAHAGLPQVNYMAVSRAQVGSHSGIDPLCDDIEETLAYPCFVKPANLGSSVGISKVRTRAQLEAALANAASYDRRLIVEAGVIAREVECAVLGNAQPQASIVGEITYQSDFYDYETKYTEGKADLIIPAALPEAISTQIQAMAIQAFTAIDAAGLARVDFFYVEATGDVFINEINTMPGFTATSMYPQLWATSGIAFPEVVDRLVQLALDRHA